MRNNLVFILIYFIGFISFAQQIKIGEWAMHLNYTNINVILNKNNTIYAGTKSGLFIYDEIDNSLTTLSKLDGLSSADITALDYNNDVLIIGYNDGNMDLIQNNQITNIPYIELANILGDKRINNIFIESDLAYISCPFGVVVYNIPAREIKETYYLSDDGTSTEIFATYVFDSDINSDADVFLANKIFLATNKGLFYADKYANLLDYNNWINDSQFCLLKNSPDYTYDLFNVHVSNVIGFDKKENGGKGLLISTEIDYSSISSPFSETSKYNFFQLNTIGYNNPLSNEKLNLFHVNSGVRGEIINFQYNPESEKTIIIVNDDYIEKVIILNELFQNILSVNCNNVEGLDENSTLISALISNNYNNTSTIYLADAKYGLVKAINKGYEIDFLEPIIPNGPAGINIGSISSGINNLMFTHGGKTQPWNNLENYQEISFFNNIKWSQSDQIIELGIYDALSISSGFKKDQFFIGTWNSGLLEFIEDSLVNHYTNKNTNGAIETIAGTNMSRIGGVDVDNDGALWLTNSQAEKPLVKFHNNIWTNYNVPNLPTNIMSGKILCLNNEQKWIQLRNEGILVAQETKDGLISRKINTGNGLPSSSVNCFIEDNNGTIWVGTSQGLAVFYFPSEIFNNSSYNAEYILIETEDGYVEKLFENTEILDIKVDGGNRKWIATKSNGVFLISDDGMTQIHNFTKQNSPLLDNTVYEISIIESSGEVFFATSKGLCSYRSDATSSRNNFNNCMVFPNPVRKNYTGIISITGLNDETNIKITDISGNLVFETISSGGTATWNGENFNGEKVSTGVYLLLCTSVDFEYSVVEKVLIYN